jgi:hypothetical protein
MTSFQPSIATPVKSFAAIHEEEQVEARAIVRTGTVLSFPPVRGRMFRITVNRKDGSCMEVRQRFADQNAAHAWGMEQQRDPADSVSVIDVERQNEAMYEARDRRALSAQMDANRRNELCLGAF